MCTINAFGSALSVRQQGSPGELLLVCMLHISSQQRDRTPLFSREFCLIAQMLSAADRATEEHALVLLV